MTKRREKRLTRANLGLLLSVLGPGIIVMMVDNDAGGIATYSVAGARYGYKILWILVPTGLLLFMVQEMNARMGVVTGKGLAALIREEFSFRLTALIMIAMIVANFANTVSDFAGISAGAEIFGIPFFISVPVAAVPAFIREAGDAVTKRFPGTRPMPFGHLGDGLSLIHI